MKYASNAKIDSFKQSLGRNYPFCLRDYFRSQ